MHTDIWGDTKDIQTRLQKHWLKFHVFAYKQVGAFEQ